MSTIAGVNHYEERMLFTLMLLRHPRARLVYVTSQPIHPAMIDYFVAMVRGISASHVRDRLTLLSTYDSSPRPLTAKILERPRLMRRILRAIDPDRAHMSCFTVSRLERTLAVRLGIPLYGVDPAHLELGTKSGSRRVFREAGVPMPIGTEGVKSPGEIANAVADIWEEALQTTKVVVKKDHGFSGEGNAVLDLGPLGAVAPGAPDAASRGGRVDRILQELPRMRFACTTTSWEPFRDEFAEMGGIVEAFVEGKNVRSPSGQLRIDPRGELECVSTHDQILGGPDGQTYAGARFPADDEYRMEIQSDALKVGRVLTERGVLGRVAVDFMAVERPEAPGTWDRVAIEINLRMSGTTHPLMIMKMLNAGSYDPKTGLFLSGLGQPRFYVCTDTLSAPTYRGLSVEDALDIAAVHGLHYRPWTDDGAVFHLLGALSQFGKLGVTAYGASEAEAQSHFDNTTQILDEATAGPDGFAGL
ncbi:MAG: carboxylate-amine ligase [Deltaproteobacteria bacterium]|nr:carboxylate-amine ligase [Deltaproteobacteria bacterium]